MIISKIWGGLKAFFLWEVMPKSIYEYPWILRTLWIVVGVDLLSKVYIYGFMLDNATAAGAYLVAFIWFGIYCLEYDTDRSSRLWMMKAIKEGWERTDQILEGWGKAVKVAEDAHQFNRFLIARLADVHGEDIAKVEADYREKLSTTEEGKTLE